MTAAALETGRILAETFIARVEYHRSLTSTNDRARQCAREGPSELPLLVVADEQTTGRGRGTNRWWTGRGSLACSLLLDALASGPADNSQPLAGLAAAVAVVEAVAPLLPEHRVGIHWPNDVYAAGRKLAGILVEVLPNRRQIVGIGLNTNNSCCDAPEALKETAVSLRDLSGREHDHTAILVVLLKHLEAALTRVSDEPGQIGARADQLCLQHGHTLTLELGRQRVTGRCLGIAADGALLLDTPQGPRPFYSGMLLRES